MTAVLCRDVKIVEILQAIGSKSSWSKLTLDNGWRYRCVRNITEIGKYFHY